jgi:hypothetical protein
LGHSSTNVAMDIYSHLMETLSQKTAIRLDETVLGNNKSMELREEGIPKSSQI